MLKKFSALSLYFLPVLAFAQGQTIEGVLLAINEIFKVLIPLLITLALIYFVWGVIKYITAGGDEERRKEGLNTMIFGVIALFVIISVWGLVGVISTTFGIDPGGSPPGVPGGAL